MNFRNDKKRKAYGHGERQLGHKAIVLQIKWGDCTSVFIRLSGFGTRINREQTCDSWPNDNVIASILPLFGKKINGNVFDVVSRGLCYYSRVWKGESSAALEKPEVNHVFSTETAPCGRSLYSAARSPFCDRGGSPQPSLANLERCSQQHTQRSDLSSSTLQWCRLFGGQSGTLNIILLNDDGACISAPVFSFCTGF